MMPKPLMYVTLAKAGVHKRMGFRIPAGAGMTDRGAILASGAKIKERLQ
jgi:hypothetical protein